MNKVKIVKASGGEDYIEYHCPGCKHMHNIPVAMEGQSRPPVWKFNYDTEKPTVTPSVRHMLGKYADPNFDDEGIAELNSQCHYFITNGTIDYCSDSTHELAGKQVDMSEI